MSVMQIMDPSGHLTINWNADNAEEVRHARETFDEMIGRRYSAFRVRKGGERGERIETFDPHAEQMILQPQLQGG